MAYSLIFCLWTLHVLLNDIQLRNTFSSYVVMWIVYIYIKGCLLFTRCRVLIMAVMLVVNDFVSLARDDCMTERRSIKNQRPAAGKADDRCSC